MQVSSQAAKKFSNLIDSPAPELYKISATESRGSARFEDILVRSPSRFPPSLKEDLAAYDCKEKELPKVLLIPSFM